MPVATISPAVIVCIIVGGIVLGVLFLWAFFKVAFGFGTMMEEVGKTSRLPVDIIVNTAEGKIWACELNGHPLHSSQTACPHDGSRVIWRLPEFGNQRQTPTSPARSDATTPQSAGTPPPPAEAVCPACGIRQPLARRCRSCAVEL